MPIAPANIWASAASPCRSCKFHNAVIRAALLLLLLAPAVPLGFPARASDMLRICFTDWPPYSWTDGQGRADGISVEILQLAARRAGVQASFVEMPWKRCLTEVEFGHLDLAMDGAPRADYIVGRESYVTSHYVFWVRGDDYLAGGSDPVRLDGRRISLIQGWWYPPELRAAAPLLDVVELDGEESQLRGLTLGRQDAAYGELITMRGKAEKLGLSVRPLQPAHISVRFYPLFHRGRAALAGRIDAALAVLREEGEIDAVYRRRLGIGLSDLARQAGQVAPRSQR